MNFQIEWHSALASTNAYLGEQYAAGTEIRSGRVIAAHEQTSGRGRQDRTWVTAPGQNLTFSLFVETNLPAQQVPSLTMAVALGVTEFLTSAGIAAAPKWPNDVLVGPHKICGILSERVVRSSPPESGVIIGIGLNVNMTADQAKSIDQPATSIQIESGVASDPPATLDALLPVVGRWISEWEDGGFSRIRDAWTAQAGPTGKPITVRDGSTRKTGALAGFGEHGELLLQTPDGIETIWSGDVSG